MYAQSTALLGGVRKPCMRSVAADKVQHGLVELLRLLHGYGMASIGNREPFGLGHVADPTLHESRRRQKVGAGTDDKQRRADRFDLGESVGRAQRLRTGVLLPRFLLRIEPCGRPFRLSGSEGWTDLDEAFG